MNPCGPIMMQYPCLVLSHTQRIHIHYMHVKRVNAQIVCRQVQALKYAFQCEMLTIAINNNILKGHNEEMWVAKNQYRATYIRAFLHLGLDKAQKMLLVHAARVVHVSIHFSHIVKISVGHTLKRMH